MKNKFLLLICGLLFIGAAHAAPNKYPTEGVIAKFSFDKGGTSSVGNYYFTDITSGGEDSGKNPSRSDLDKYVQDGYFVGAPYDPIHLRLKPTNTIFAQPQISFVIRFKLPEDHSSATLFMSTSTYYTCKINKKGCVVYSCAKSRKAHKKYNLDYNIDFKIKPAEWTTLVATFDTTTSQVSFSANGLTETLSNPIVNEKYPNISNVINQYLTFHVSRREGDGEDEYVKGDPTTKGYVDDIVMYDRVLTQEEITALVGIDGKLEHVDAKLLKPGINIIWQISVFQLLCGLLMAWLLYASSKKKQQHITTSAEADNDKALEHLKVAFSYWQYDVEQMGGLPTSYTELSYPTKRRELNRSLSAYKKAAAAGSTDQEIVDAINLLADLHNSATRYIFDCKWWVFSAPVFAVYFKEMLASFLQTIGFDMTMTNFVSLPEGVIDQFLYFTIYYLPTVLISALVVYISCHTHYFHRVKGKVVDQYDFEPQSFKQKVLLPLRWILIGMAPGLGVIPLLLVGAGVYFLGLAGENIEIYNVKTIFSNGTTRTDSQADPSGAIMIVMIAAAVFLALWLAASAVIYAFHMAFIYFFIRNFVFRKFF